MADNETPISPVTQSKPEISISAAAINDQPVELDSTPTSPENMKNGRKGSKPEILSPEERKKREQLIENRQADPAVLVNISQTPSAEEFSKSTDAEATGPANNAGKKSS